FRKNKSFKGRGMLFTELKNHLKRPISIFSSFRGRNNRFFYRVADLRCNRAGNRGGGTMVGVLEPQNSIARIDQATSVNP
ncbi:MAG: hypothetical protein Q8O62_07150, partial [Aequorivita sp.]|nr:hypothetical protein [Aequorivita sp.]